MPKTVPADKRSIPISVSIPADVAKRLETLTGGRPNERSAHIVRAINDYLEKVSQEHA